MTQAEQSARAPAVTPAVPGVTPGLKVPGHRSDLIASRVIPWCHRRAERNNSIRACGLPRSSPLRDHPERIMPFECCEVRVRDLQPIGMSGVRIGRLSRVDVAPPKRGLHTHRTCG